MSDQDRLLHHEYDGIQEYDNPLPFWWSAIFVLTIVFAAGYWLWFHGGGPGRSDHAVLEERYAEYQARRAAVEAESSVVVTEEALAVLAGDGRALELGRRLFVQNCAGCHQEDGRGSVGPNLTDEFQIHGSARMDLYRTIRDGVPAKGMIPWGSTLAPRETAAVTAYVATLRGRNLPDGKAPEGGKVSALP
jgi:cytochrome c oxidase cbb3-type subunit III